MVWRVALVMALLATSLARASEPMLAIGAALPPLKGTDLAGREVVLPAAAHGRVGILMFGFSYGSRTAVESWAHHVQGRWAADPRVAWYQLPMVGGLARLAKPFITGGMRKETPEAYRGNSVVVFGGTGPWKERLGVDDDRAAYLVVTDRNGRVQWRHAGDFGPAGAEALDRAVADLLDRPGAN